MRRFWLGPCKPPACNSSSDCEDRAYADALREYPACWLAEREPGVCADKREGEISIKHGPIKPQDREYSVGNDDSVCG